MRDFLKSETGKRWMREDDDGDSTERLGGELRGKACWRKRAWKLRRKKRTQYRKKKRMREQRSHTVENYNEWKIE